MRALATASGSAMTRVLAIEQSDPAKIVKDQASWFMQVSAGINPAAPAIGGRELSARRAAHDQGDSRARSSGSSATGGRARRAPRPPRAPCLRVGTTRHGARSTSCACGSSRSAAVSSASSSAASSRACADEARGQPLAVKRVLDPVAAAAGLVVLARSTPGSRSRSWSTPAGRSFSRRARASDDRPFRMLKFRTMVPDAISVGRHQGISEDPFGIVPDDPRITQGGRFLRRTGSTSSRSS